MFNLVKKIKTFAYDHHKTFFTYKTTDKFLC